jgi:RNA polymerase sigma-70 factor (ECF subfamily)
MDGARDHELASLLTRAQRGDADAYEQFLRAAAHELRGFLRRRMRADDDAEDVLQDTLIAVDAARATYQPGRAVAPWLYAICSHRMLDFYRRRRRSERLAARVSSVPPSSSPSESSSESSESSQALADRVAAALDALRSLPARQRRVVELLKLSDLSVKEVAARTGMNESAVKVTAFRGYEGMRRLLGVERKRR